MIKNDLQFKFEFEFLEHGESINKMIEKLLDRNKNEKQKHLNYWQKC